MALDKYYSRLGVPRSATKKDVKQVYRDKARKLHPDMNTDNTEQAESDFKDLSEAYLAIIDHLDNKKVDINAQPKSTTSTHNTNHRLNLDEEVNNIWDIFDMIFNRRSSREPRPQPRSSKARSEHQHDQYTICLKCRR